MEGQNASAEIIAIGTELTIGQVLDTNSHYLARGLDALGFRVESIQAIPDDWGAMKAAIEQALGRSRVTVVTGGLGPTGDDFTKEVLQEVFGGEWLEDAETLEAIGARLQRRGLEMSERNRAQAMIPSSCQVLQNRLGTAPGMLFARGEHVLISLPGVPMEMQALFEEKVRPAIAPLSEGGRYHRTLNLYGTAESYLADELEEWEASLAPDFSLAYLPSAGGIRLRITGKGETSGRLQELGEARVEALRAILGTRLYGEESDTLATAVGRLLKAQGKTVATAESCTAGRMGALLTEACGASAYYRGGVIAYSNAAKQELLGVPREVLEQSLAVSAETAEAMARGVRSRLKADYGLSTTGLVGPEGDGTDVPVGTVWVGWADATGAGSTRLYVNGTREINMDRAAQHALNYMRLKLLGA